MPRSAIKNGLLGIAALYPLGVLMALTVGFPVAIPGGQSSGEVAQWAVFYTWGIPWGRGIWVALGSPFLVTFYGNFVGLFPVAALVGVAIGNAAGAFRARQRGQELTCNPANREAGK